MDDIRSVIIGILVFLILIGAVFFFNRTGRTIEQTTEDWNIIKIGKCQYLQRSKGNVGYFSHKGDCTNPIHCHN